MTLPDRIFIRDRGKLLGAWFPVTKLNSEEWPVIGTGKCLRLRYSAIYSVTPGWNLARGVRMVITGSPWP